MAETLEKIVDQISELSVLELSDLVKQLEEKFGVEAAAPMMMGAMAAFSAVMSIRSIKLGLIAGSAALVTMTN